MTFNHSWQGADNQARLDSVTGVFNYQFTYDPLFRLWGINNSGSQTWRLHDGQDMVLEHRDIGTPNDRWARYVHGPGTDDVLAMELYPVGALPNPGTGSIYFYHKDAEGSVRLLTDASGAVANSYLYDSFGKKLTSVESAPQTYAWKGRDFIQGADIYFNRARWFDPQLGRFIEEDPLGYGGGDSNRYAFAWNNPVKWKDFSGLSATEEAETSVVGGATAANIYKTGLGIACDILMVSTGLEPILTTPVGSPCTIITAERKWIVGPYNQLTKLKKGLAPGLEAHHLIEQKFLSLFSVTTDVRKWTSVILPTEVHKVVTKVWRQEVNLFGGVKTVEDVKAVARRVYKDYPEFLRLMGL